MAMKTTTVTLETGRWKSHSSSVWANTDCLTGSHFGHNTEALKATPSALKDFDTRLKMTLLNEGAVFLRKQGWS